MGSSVLDTLLLIKLVELSAMDNMRPANERRWYTGSDYRDEGLGQYGYQSRDAFVCL